MSSLYILHWMPFLSIWWFSKNVVSTAMHGVCQSNYSTSSIYNLNLNLEVSFKVEYHANENPQNKFWKNSICWLKVNVSNKKIIIPYQASFF